LEPKPSWNYQKRHFLLVHAYRFVAFTFVAGMALTPALPSQTAKRLIGDACYTSYNSAKKRTLWSYVAERHSNGHVFREQVIETVEVPVRHLLAVDGNPPTSVQLKEENDRHQSLLKMHLGGTRSGNNRTMTTK